MLLLIIKLENERTLNMEKTKYILSRLALIAIGTAVVIGALRGLVYIANNFGFEPQHIVSGIGITLCFGMLVYWLGEGYEIKKRYESLDK